MTAEELLERAQSVLGKRTKYPIGVKRKVPDYAATWPEGAICDCSGYVAWCLKANRREPALPYSGAFHTTPIHADAFAGTAVMFRRLDRVRVGALLVYPDYFDGNQMRDGHIGIVLETHGPRVQDITKIIHCGKTAFVKTGDAVAITGPEAWRKHAASSIPIWHLSVAE